MVPKKKKKKKSLSDPLVLVFSVNGTFYKIKDNSNLTQFSHNKEPIKYSINKVKKRDKMELCVGLNHKALHVRVQNGTQEQHDGWNKTTFYFQKAAQRIRQSYGQVQKAGWFTRRRQQGQVKYRQGRKQTNR